MVLEADKPTSVTMSAITDKQGASQFAIRQSHLPKGRTKVDFPAPKGVTLVTQACLQAQSCTKIKPGVHANFLAGPFDSSDVQNAGVGGLLAGLTVTALIAWRRVSGVSDSPERLL